ncbi:MAG: fibronectin type III domain-containing protein [bacterium]
MNAIPNATNARRSRFIVTLLCATTLSIGALGAANAQDRPIAERKTNKPLSVYPADRAFFFADDIARKRPSNYMHIYWTEGEQSAEYMCRRRPNALFNRDMNYIGKYLIYPQHPATDCFLGRCARPGDPKMHNGRTYTVMVDWQGQNNCHYQMAYVTPDHAVSRESLEPVIRDINPGKWNVSHTAGDGAVELHWNKPGGDVRSYGIYYLEGATVTPGRLCRDHPNAIQVERGTREFNQRKQIITGLERGQPYTFMVEANYARKREDSVTCAYNYLFVATSKKINIHTVTHKNPDQNHTSATPGEGRIRLRWRKERGASRFHLYHIKGKHDDIRRLCGMRPNPIVLDGKTTDHTFRGLESGARYTFLVEADYSGGNYLPPELRSHCDYVYHTHATPQ